ncbi:MAG: hypothetical protein CMH57_02400 [Myxococcales bacterium]|nr:hypothetical protein [Myxococcales bacterium]
MSNRTKEFAKVPAYEEILEGVNGFVAPWTTTDAQAPTRPWLMIAGVPRSGTTLLYQVLAASGGFCYPSNIIARYYRSPAFGLRTQRLLEPLLERGAPTWASRAGNTDAWWEPHEFGYFWQHHLPLKPHHEPTDPSMASLARALAEWEAEATRPLLMKNPILCYVLPDLVRAFPTMHVLHIQRDPVDVGVSILNLRRRFHGDVHAWTSLRPRDADAFADASPAEQVAAQILSGEQALQRAAEAAEGRWTSITYEALCDEPHHVVHQCAERLGATIALTGIPERFTARRSAGNTRERDAMRDALDACPLRRDDSTPDP